tara:strand:+ start:115034 stop:117028 length:1995 start_codon:yes stop_codon:yes gene_type:complete
MAISLPSKLIRAEVSNISGYERWIYDDGTGDPYWSGGSSPRFYRWTVDVTVTKSNHSSHLTRKPFEYNGYDVAIGDWLANTSTGTAHKIVGIVSKSETTLSFILEDVDRYNTYRDPGAQGSGAPQAGSALIFTLNEEGEPLLDGLTPGTISSIFFANLMSRFQNINLEYDYPMTQEGHSFQIGDIVAADPSTNSWVLSAPEYPYIVGRVSALGPGPDGFYVTPVQRIIDDLDSLPGDVASILYLDENNAGKITTNVTDHIMYIKTKEATVTEHISDVINPTTTAGNKMSVNGVEVTFSVGDTSDIISSINAVTGTTGVLASSVAPPTSVTGSVGDLAYGVTGAIGNTSQAEINGVLVTFDLTTNGTAQFGTTAANVDDMIAAIERDMNAAGNADIYGEDNNGLLRLYDRTGGAINITNIASDGSGNNFAGPASSTGLPLSTSGTSDVQIKVEGSDAGPISTRNVSGTPVEDTGLYTVENGAKAEAMYVEQGLRVISSGSGGSSMTVVADVNSRDILNPLVGDQAYVIDDGNSEWAIYLWTGQDWVRTADEDSARTDADTMTVELNFDSQPTLIIGSVSPGSRITLITVTVTTEFDGSAELTLGPSTDPDRLMDNDLLDLATEGTYSIQSDMVLDNGDGTDSVIIAAYKPNGSTVGSAIISVSYM